MPSFDSFVEGQMCFLNHLEALNGKSSRSQAQAGNIQALIQHVPLTSSGSVSVDITGIMFFFLWKT